MLFEVLVNSLYKQIDDLQSKVKFALTFEHTLYEQPGQTLNNNLKE